MGYTGKEAMAFKEAYIARFNEMEEALRHTSAAVTSSLQVAEAFEKQHLHVMRDIREILSKCSQQFGESNFGLSCACVLTTTMQPCVGGKGGLFHLSFLPFQLPLKNF